MSGRSNVKVDVVVVVVDFTFAREVAKVHHTMMSFLSTLTGLGLSTLFDELLLDFFLFPLGEIEASKGTLFLWWCVTDMYEPAEYRQVSRPSLTVVADARERLTKVFFGDIRILEGLAMR